MSFLAFALTAACSKPHTVPIGAVGPTLAISQVHSKLEAVAPQGFAITGYPSGVSTAPEMLPRGWGTFGQLLPSGGSATLLRSTAYFSGAGATSAVVVLTGWALTGLALVGIAAACR